MLARIADNTTAVWDWAPPGTPVRGCLVLGNESRPNRNQYDYGKGPVVVHTPATLAQRARGRSETRARARRARRGRGVEASSGVRIARRLDVTWTCDPPGRAESPVPEFPHHNRSPPSTKAQPVPLSPTMRGSPAANAVSCARARQPATTCERSRPRARSSGPEPRGADSGRGPRPVRRRTGRRRGEESSIEPATGGGGPIRARDAHDSGGRANTSKRVQNAHRIHARRSRRRSRCGVHRPGRGGRPAGEEALPGAGHPSDSGGADTPDERRDRDAKLRCGLRERGERGRAAKADVQPAVGTSLRGPGRAGAVDHVLVPVAPVAGSGAGHSRVQLSMGTNRSAVTMAMTGRVP